MLDMDKPKDVLARALDNRCKAGGKFELVSVLQELLLSVMAAHKEALLLRSR